MKSLLFVILFTFSTQVFAQDAYSFVTNFNLEQAAPAFPGPIPIPIPFPKGDDNSSSDPGQTNPGLPERPGHEGFTNIDLSYPTGYEQAQFKFVQGQACAASYPPRCSGTIVRLDDTVYFGPNVNHRLSVNLADYFGPGPVIVTIHGPNKSVTVRY